MDKKTNIVIIGGGIAGVSCLDSLLSDQESNRSLQISITLLSESRVIKKVVNHKTRGRNLESFDIETADVDRFYCKDSTESLNFRFVVGKVICIDGENRLIYVDGFPESTSKSRINFTIGYDKLCLANGSSPRSLGAVKIEHPGVVDRIFTIRDTTSVEEFRKSLVNIRKVAIIGDGGISLELVHSLSNCHIFWVIRHDFVGHPFLDSEASKFLLNARSSSERKKHPLNRKLNAYDIVDTTHQSTIGPALGPHWLNGMTLSGRCKGTNSLEIFYNAEVQAVSINKAHDHELTIILRDSQVIEADLMVLAIGVVPNKIRFDSREPAFSPDEGILIDSEMRTSIRDIYAVGDVACCADWSKETLWFQMRLWSQARHLGHYGGKCISAHLLQQDPSIYANFDCFTHVTSFLGFKIVLLGRFNEQHLLDKDNKKLEVIARINQKKDYVKLVLDDNRLIGAIMVGETNLEETIENLILDQIDIEEIKYDILDDAIDIEDYFD